MPSSAARAFIRLTKAPSLPQRNSARATALSLALAMMVVRSSCQNRWKPSRRELTVAYCPRLMRSMAEV